MILEIDESNIVDVTSAIKKLHKIRTTLLRSHPGAMISNVRWEKRLASIEKEFNFARSIFEANLQSDEGGEFYVYAHCDPTKSLNIKDNPQHLFAATCLGLSHPPFYVGKGVGDRAFDLNRNEGHRKVRSRLKKNNVDVQVVILKKDLSEKSALYEEGRLIDIFGLRLLKEKACLINLDEGQFVDERRSKYPKGSGWYLNRIGIKPHSVPKG
jgi:hypothetical protein